MRAGLAAGSLPATRLRWIPRADEARRRTWGFFAELLAASQAKLQQHRGELQRLAQHGEADGEIGKEVRAKMERVMHLVHGIATTFLSPQRPPSGKEQ